MCSFERAIGSVLFEDGQQSSKLNSLITVFDEFAENVLTVAEEDVLG